MTGTPAARVVIAAGGLGIRVSGWSRYLPKEFYPVAGRPGIAHLLDEIAALAPAEAVLVYHPYYEPFAAWARVALSQRGHDSYLRAAGLARAAGPAAQVTLSFIPQHGLYADITSVLNGADHLAATGDLYVAFADNLYPAGNPLLDLRAAPPGHVAVLARGYNRELASARGVIAAIRHDGHLLVSELAEKPDPSRPANWNAGTAPRTCSCSKAGPGSPRSSSAPPAPASSQPAPNRNWHWRSPAGRTLTPLS